MDDEGTQLDAKSAADQIFGRWMKKWSQHAGERRTVLGEMKE
jgi:hypothetical protein